MATALKELVHLASEPVQSRSFLEVQGRSGSRELMALHPSGLPRRVLVIQPDRAQGSIPREQ